MALRASGKTSSVVRQPRSPTFYGVQATGNGHIYRYRGIAAGLRDCGWPVVSAAVGQEQFARNAGTNHWMLGLSFDVGSKHIRITQTLARGLRDLPGYVHSVERVVEWMEDARARVAVSDFEPLTSRAAVDAGLPLLILDNQTSVFCRSRRRKRHHALVALARTFTSLWYGIKPLARFHSMVTVSLSPELPGLDGQVVVPAPVRHEILDLHPVAGDHVVLYASFGGIPPELLQAAATTHQDLEIRIHVPDPPADLDRVPPNVVIRKAPSPVFLEDVRTAGGIIAQAGFMTSAEAALLGKPVAMVPLRGQFEQILNGMEFERLGIGKVFPDYGPDLLTWIGANRNRPRTDSEVTMWLGRGVDATVQVVDECLNRAVEGKPGPGNGARIPVRGGWGIG
jgi:uncharacterized protein (TIGR00661 family)